ncbi:MAG TPA: hypothetical protein ENF77_06225 [Candidatus Acetothermia bacterium]|nr:hypothetical protein [Candidatus Acetothermia bacterium]
MSGGSAALCTGAVGGPTHSDADELDHVVAAIGRWISHVEDEEHGHLEERLTLASSPAASPIP